MFRNKQTETNSRRRPVQRSNTPSPVFSYYNNRSQGDVQRARYELAPSKRRGLARLSHVPTAIALIVIIGSLAYASLLGTTPRMKILASSSGHSFQRPDGVYESYIEKQLGRSFFNKSKFTINTEAVADSLRNEFPEIDSVSVAVPLLGHKPVVTFAISSPAFILASSDNGAYYVSDKGVPLVKVSDVADQPENMTTITDESGVTLEVGKPALPVDTVLFIRNVLLQLDATDNKIESVILPARANELEVQLQGREYRVRFNTVEDARQQVGTLLAVENRLRNTGEKPKEYIDVRVSERAYYK